MSGRVVEVTTGSRLHFGMLSFGHSNIRQFGGMGVMVECPSVHLRITAAPRLAVSGKNAAAVRTYAERIALAGWSAHEPPCQIEVLAVPAPHVGLGSGTQLGLAVAAGLSTYCERGPLSTAELVHLTGRGQRSAVGLYGFLQGGLILEAGKTREGEVSPLVSRVAFPEAWRFLLVRASRRSGLSGEAEKQAFRDIPPIPTAATERMCREALLELVPAAIEEDFDRFSMALYRFGEEAGRSFAPLQNGVFASREVAATVESLRELGVVGVGQSSWGPTVFAVLKSQASAEQVAERLRVIGRDKDLDLTITRARNQPARVVAS